MQVEVQLDGLVVAVRLRLADLALELDSVGLSLAGGGEVVLLVVLLHCHPVSAAQVAADGRAVVRQAGSADQANVLTDSEVGIREGSLVQLQVLVVLRVDVLYEHTVPELLGTMTTGGQLGFVPGLRLFFLIRVLLFFTPWLL